MGIVPALALLVVTAAGAPAQAAPRIGATVSVGSGRVVSFSGKVTGARVGNRVQVESRRGGRWARDRASARLGGGGKFVLRWRVAQDRPLMSVRLVVVDRATRRQVARGRTLRMQITRAVSFSVPSTTRLYASEDIVAAAPGPRADQITVDVEGGGAPPRPGGHVALGPATGLNDGMFGRVVSVRRRGGARARLVLAQAALDEVLDSLHVNVNRAVTPTIIDASGTTVPGSQTLAAGEAPTVLRGQAAVVPYAETRAGSHDAFACTAADGTARAPSTLWNPTASFPVKLDLRNVRVIQRLHAGRSYADRDSTLLFAFNATATATAGFQAKAAFKCALTPTYRRNHRLRFRVGSIGPVPVSVTVEPTFRIEVSAPGRATYSQRHHFGLTFKKRGAAAGTFTRSYNPEPLRWTDADARPRGTVSAGGDLSLLLGGGPGSEAAQSALYGPFGPRFALTATKPGCAALKGQLRADIDVRFQHWFKRWRSQQAALSTTPTGGEGCGTGPPGVPATPAGFPSRLKASGRSIVDEANSVLPKLKGFNMHVAPGFAWEQSHFDAIAAIGGTINRAVLHWDEFEPTQGVVNPAAVAALDQHVARAEAAGIYTMLELHLNVGLTPAWTAAHGPELEKYAAYGQTLTEYLAHRYGDPSSPTYTKSVIGFGLNEPPIEDDAIRNGDASIPYLENKQRQMIAWMRAPGNAPDWIGFVAVGYAGATPLYDRSRTLSAVDASPTAYDSVGGNVVFDVHDYMMGCEVPADNSLSTDPNCDGRQRNGQKHPTHQGGPLINTNAADHSSYVSTAATRAQMTAYLKPYKDFTTQAAIPLMVGEFGWPNGKTGEVAWITDKKPIWADAGTAIEIHWNYDVNSANSIWSARPGGNWSPTVTTWMSP